MENSNHTSSAPTGRVGSPSDSGSSSEEVGDAQDEEPSSSKKHLTVETELDNFRRQWKREIESSPSKENSRTSPFSTQPEDDAENIEERARKIFLRGVSAERNGKLQDAIASYRRAIQLVPDIEFRVSESFNDTREEFSVETEDESTLEEEFSDSDGDDGLDNLVIKFQKISAKFRTSRICQPKLEQTTTHISNLPPEVFLYILKWVISQDLDVYSLEQVAKVCRGFYICARDPEIWRLVCLRTWDVSIDSINWYGSWRNMFLQRPHLSFNGVYISQTTYIRYGESSFQDANYRPCYIVKYYRYLRFFPDGVVLMLTTPDDPYQSLYKLRHRKSKFPNVMYGRYKLVGSTVIAMVRKSTTESVNSPATNFYRFRRQRQANNMQEMQDQTFHLELEVKNVKKRINCQLSWSRYYIHVIYRNGQETVSNFDLIPSNFPSFWFSRVKSFAAESESPLN